MHKITIYRHKMMHFVYAAATMVLMGVIVIANNRWGHPSWAFDLTMVLLWFIGAGRAALYWVREDRFVGDADEAVRWIKEKDLEGLRRD